MHEIPARARISLAFLPMRVFLYHRVPPRPALLTEDHLFHPVELAFSQQVSPVLDSCAATASRTMLSTAIDFLFVCAHDVVVKRGASDDAAGGVLELGRRIDHNRWVTGARANGALATSHRLAYHAAATGHCEETNALVAHEHLGGFNGRLSHGGYQVGRSAGTDNCLVQEADIGHGALTGARVHIENDAIARCKHGDRVADNGGSRVGCRRNGADHTVGRVFGQRQAVIPGDGMRCEHLCAGSLARDQAVLDYLVLNPPQASLSLCVARKFLGVLEHRFANGRNDLLPSFERHAIQFTEGDTRRFDGVVHRCKKSLHRVYREERWQARCLPQ